MWVASATKAESSARVLPRLALTVPMETKLRQLLPQSRGGLLFELNPNPLADNLGEIKQVGIDGVQQGQNLVGGMVRFFFRASVSIGRRLSCFGASGVCACGTTSFDS